VLIRRAAITGLGLLGAADGLPLLRQAAAEYADEGRYSEDAETEGIESAHRDYQNALLAALLCGDGEAAGPVVDILLANAGVIARAAREEGGRQSARAWQQQLLRRLAAAPQSVLPALAERIAAEQNTNITPIAFAVLGGKTLSPESAKQLRESENAVVAELGKR
jgi:hypothetical protein